VRVNGVDRHYSIEELEELQTLPAGYTKAAGSDTKRAEVIGDGYTVVVIEAILRGANLGSERAEPMEVEPAAGGDAGAGSGGGSSAADTQAMPPPAPVSPAPAPAPAPAAAQSMPSQAEMWAMMQAMRLENQATNQRVKAAEEARQAAEEAKLAAEEKAKAATAKLEQVRDSRVRKQADRDASSVTDSDKARGAGEKSGKKVVKPTPTVTDKRKGVNPTPTVTDKRSRD
jgi:pyruvate/2-oxoglutarate dehydrogenase complex dihydrolipoamide acyltransferase (E2) component